MPVALPRRFCRVVLAFVVAASLVALPAGPSAPQPTAAAPTITEFATPPVDGPTGIVAGPDGNLWFTIRDGNAIGRITPAGTITTFDAGLTANSQPQDIAVGPDGNLWFTEFAAGKIGKITTAGTITEYTIPNGTIQQPFGIAAGPDGNLWFTQQDNDDNPDQIGRITTDGATITSFAIPTANSRPMGIVSGPDGNLWFTQRDADKIAKITTAGTVTEFPLRDCPCAPEGVTVGPDNALWIAEAAGAITRIDTSGNITDFFPPDANALPKDIVAGPDGALWYTSYGLQHIGRVTTTGVFEQFTPPTASGKPYNLAPGPDGNVWFTEETGDRIGRVKVDTVALSLTINGAGRIASPQLGAITGAATHNYWRGDLVTLVAQPTAGSTFIGWQVDGIAKGWATALTITADAAHSIQATFATTVAFPDVTGAPFLVPVTALASRGTIFGYTNGNYGPNDGVQRAQMAALIARATTAGPDTPPTPLMPPACLIAATWDCENWGNTFTDRGGLDANLWRNAGTLQHYGVALGYTAADCTAKGKAAPCFGPTDPVSYAQTITFITRMMIKKGYWLDQSGTAHTYAGVPAPHAGDIATFHFYTGGIPDAPTTAAIWNAPAKRGWFAQALWSALNSYWGTDGTLPDGRNAGGQVP